MRTRRTLSALLALALLLGCMGWTPTRAEEATLETNSGTVTENIQALDSAEKTDILQQEEARGKEHIARLHNEEGLNQHIYLNRDGSKTMYLYDHPVKYLDTDGKMQDISLEIAQTEDARYPYRTKANSAVTSFPADMADGIRLDGEGVSIRLAAQMPVSSGKNPLNRNARQINGEKVAYTYDAKTSIEYSLTYAGFKEDIVVSQYTGQTEYQFTLYTNGLTLTELSGSYYLTDAEGEIRASIGEIIVFTADERNNTMGELLATTVEENQVYNMTILLDGDYLADPNTTYPIRIDPTLELVYENAGATALEDVVIQSNNTPLPQYTASVIGKSSKGISRLLVRFPGIDFYAMEGVTVTSAYLSIRDLLCEAEVMTLTCYPFTGSEWTETTANWSMSQSWGAALDSYDISYANGRQQTESHRYNFDISALVQQWVDGTVNDDLGVILRADDSVEQSSENFYKTFGSYERSSNKTYFVMEYNENISLSREDVDVYVGDSLTLYASTFPSGQNVTWSSENPEIATVEHGTVTGISPGTTTITARIDEDSVATCEVTVLPKSVTLNPTSLEMYVGQEKTITATTQPTGENVEWDTENPEIATVVNGVVTGVSAGSTRIVAELDEGTCAYCTVTVELAQIWLDIEEVTLGTGETLKLSASTIPEGMPVRWFTGDDTVATVEDDGFVRANGPGFTYITASLPDATTVACAITVVESGISLNYTNLDVDEGTVCTTLQATTVPANRNVTWKSSNTSVASISQTGEITAKKAGVTIITASLYQGISATCTLYVTVKDGVYLIQNYQTQYYLGVEGSKINNLSNVQQQALSSATGKVESLCQLWKIEHIGTGIYSLHPMHYPEKALDVTNNNVDIYTVSDEPYTEWRITRNDLGYSFENMDTDGYVMMPEDNSFEIGANVIVDVKTTNTIYRWLLIEQTAVISGAILYDTATQEAVVEPSRHLAVGETKSLASLNLDVVAYSSIEAIPRYYWTSMDEAVATVNPNTGAVTGVGVGTTALIGRVYLNNERYFCFVGVCVGYPDLFNSMIDLSCIEYTDCAETDDGFFFVTKPLSEIFISQGIQSLPPRSEAEDEWEVVNFYDDWYIYAIRSGTTVSYSLCKMRECETDGFDNNDPGVTVSFVELNSNIFEIAIVTGGVNELKELRTHFNSVTGPGVIDLHSDHIAGYFREPSSKGAYLIAEEYVQFMVKFYPDGEVDIPEECVELINQTRDIDIQLSDTTLSDDIRLALLTNRSRVGRIPDALTDINQKSGRTIYDEMNMVLHINNVHDLTLYEKQALLSIFCADVSFNSFAAEVQFHADALYSKLADVFDRWYSSALRADISIDDGSDNIFFDDYHYLNSDIVKEQISIHGEY